MRVAILASLAFILGIFALSACNSNEAARSQMANASPQKSATPQSPTDSVRRISAEELHDLWEKDKVLIVDTRGDAAYKESHIKGSISIPAGSVQAKLEELPRDRMIVAYCT